MQTTNSKRTVFILLCLQQAAISFNVAALTASIPTISRDLHITDVLGGKIIAYYMIPYGLSALIYAPLAQKFSTRFLMIATMFLFAITNFLCAKIETIEHILYLRVLVGVVSAGVVPLGLILIGNMFEKSLRGRMVGLFFSGSFIAALSGIILSATSNWRWLFYIPSLLAFVAALLLLMTRSPYLKRMTACVDYRQVFKDPILIKILLYITIISTLYHGVDRWLGVYMGQVYGFNQVTVSCLFGILTISGVVMQNLGGQLSDRIGRLFSCRLGIALLAIGTILLSFKFNLFILIVILLVLSTGWNIGHNGASTVLTDFDEEKRSEIAGLNSALRFFGGGVGFSITGIFVAKSFSMTFLGIGILLFVLFLMVGKLIPDSTKV